MREQIQVSAIVATYNPDEKALRATLESIVCQKGVVWEVIITDDGSTQKDFSWLPEYFAAYEIQRYQLLENPENKGTVRNCLTGLEAAEGEYIFDISPGDLLYDEYTLSDFYQFAKQGDKKICFGNAVYYYRENGCVHYSEESIAPRNPDAYAKSAGLAKLNFFRFDFICGTAFFRHRKVAIQYYEKAAQCCKYVEDNSSTAYYLADGERIWYYDRNVSWYENGIGISTSGSTKWDKIISQEFKLTFLKIHEMYPRDRIVQYSVLSYLGVPRWKIRIRKLLQYPLITIAVILLRSKGRRKKLYVTQKDFEYLQRLLTWEEA